MEEAWRITAANCNQDNFHFNNTMWLYLWPTYTKDGKIVIANVDCNWNAWNLATGLEITWNIIDNFKGDKTSSHEPVAGHDMSVFLAYVNKVWIF